MSDTWKRTLAVLWLVASAAIAGAQPAPAPADDPEATALQAEQAVPREERKAEALDALAAAITDEPATLSVWNREIFVFRATIQSTPAERARGAAHRIRSLPEASLGKEIRAVHASVGVYRGVLLEIGGTILFGIVEADLDPISGLSLEGAAQVAIARIREVLDARMQQQRPGRLLAATARSIAATMVLLAVGLFGYRLRRRWTRRLLHGDPERLRRLKLGGFDLGAHALGLVRWLSLVLGLTLRLGLVYLWLTYVLAQFPMTEPWSEKLGHWLVALLLGMGRAAVASIPGLVTATLIFLAARGLTRIVGGFFDGVADGRFEVTWLYPETAAATRRIAGLAIWIFALALAYPFLPGADSLAFKGISVLLGLTLSLGSAGILNHVMAGWVVTYSRSVRVGDFVRIGENEGRVLALGVLAVKIVNGRGEEITIPNAVVTSNVSTNFTRQAQAGGSVATTSVTIGYDAPWRQVHAMLLEAARRTRGVLAEPAPRVWQRALSDFYPEYDLVIELAAEAKRPEVMTELHGHIQDLFNEHGVQIMSPHFEGQPEQPVLSPKSAWFEPPAKPENPR